MKPELIRRGWDIAQKLSILGLVVMIGFYVDTKIEVSNITDNKEDIQALRIDHKHDLLVQTKTHEDDINDLKLDYKHKIIILTNTHEADKTVLHGRLTRYKNKLDSALISIENLKTTLKFLEKEHP